MSCSRQRTSFGTYDTGSDGRVKAERIAYGKHPLSKDVYKRQRQAVMPIVYACMNMSKTKTGALIVIEQQISLENYEKSGDMIDALINARLIENIFFKNSPLHDGAIIIANGRIKSAGCILPVSCLLYTSRCV